MQLAPIHSCNKLLRDKLRDNKAEATAGCKLACKVRLLVHIGPSTAAAELLLQTDTHSHFLPALNAAVAKSELCEAYRPAAKVQQQGRQL